MPSSSNVCIIGYLGRDPEFRADAGQSGLCNASVGVSRKDRTGEEHTDWYKITVWGKSGENLASWCRAGDLIEAHGRLEMQSWTTREGEARVTPTILCDAWGWMKLAEGKNHGQGKPKGQADTTGSYGPGEYPPLRPDERSIGKPGGAQAALGQDDIPF